MSYQRLKLFVIWFPPIVIGSFEIIRHELLLEHLSMEAGNYYIIGLTLLLSYLFSNWMFRKIHRMNTVLAGEQSRRAVLEERERLARDLHDHIAQMLFYLNVQLKQGKTEEARSAVSEIDHHLRQAIFNLRSSPDEDTSFPERLDRWLQEWSAITGVDAERSIEWTEGLFPPKEQSKLFAIIQESFANIRKHSHADRAWLSFVSDESGVWGMTIRDNGVGIQVPPAEGGNDRTDGSGSRYGLSMMRRRAEELGAAFVLSVSEEGGTVMQLTGRKGRSDIR